MAAIVLILAFLSHEIDDGGQFKQCVYNYQGEPYYVTWPRYRVCPVTIEVSPNG